MEARMPDHECKADVPDYPDNKVTLAFGELTFPVLVTKLGSEDPTILNSALRAACRILPTALNTTKAVTAGAIPEFARLSLHADVEIKRRATEALVLSLQQGAAKEAFVKTGCLDRFKPVVTDDDTEVRKNGLTALETLAHTAPWIHDMQAAGYVALLVSRIRPEKEGEVQTLILRVLSKVCNQGSPGQAEAVASGDAVEAIIGVLMSPHPGVREDALRLLTLLAFTDAGKTLAIKGGAVPELLRVLDMDGSAGVRAEAAGSAMVIAVDNAGKLAFIDAGLEPLVKVLGDTSAMVRQNAMRAISSVAAHPDGRPALLSLHVDEALEKAIGSASGREKEIAEKTRSVVNWRP